MTLEQLIKRLAICGCGLLVVGILVGWLMGRRHTPPDEFADLAPVILQMHKLGQLHTVSFHESDVLHQNSVQEPASWASEIPGADSVTHWATHNEALIVADGTVEAGIDLSHLSEKDVQRIKQPDGTTHLRVRLPAVTIYPPNVQVHVENAQAGPFWRDENIVPKAQAHAGVLFVQAAEKAGIRAKAQANAIEQLQHTLQTLGLKDVELTF